MNATHIGKEWTSFDVENALSAIEINAIFYDVSKKDVISEIRGKFPAIKFFRINDNFQVGNYKLSKSHFSYTV